MISCRGLCTRTVAQYRLGWASILPTTYREREKERGVWAGWWQKRACQKVPLKVSSCHLKKVLLASITSGLLVRALIYLIWISVKAAIVIHSELERVFNISDLRLGSSGRECRRSLSLKTTDLFCKVPIYKGWQKKNKNIDILRDCIFNIYICGM